MKKVILSIKPEFVEKILNGEKKFEYRKVIFKDTEVKKVLIYASAPISKVVGEFKIKNILEGLPDALWYQTCKKSGISYDYFSKYFKKRAKGYAIEIKRVKKYRKPKDISTFGMKAPQSFAYIK